MRHSEVLSRVRKNTVINEISKKQEESLMYCVQTVMNNIQDTYNVNLTFNKRLYNTFIVSSLNSKITNNNAHLNVNSFVNETYNIHESSFITPDGGIVYLTVNGCDYPVLISEVKHQGTNNNRQKNGLKKQAMGNAIERASKNILATEFYMEKENIFPYVIFADGCDFDPTSSICDRLLPNIRYGKLNTIYLYDDFVEYDTKIERVKRPSIFVRVNKWTNEEMCSILSIIMLEAIKYYNIKYELGLENVN